MAVHAHHAVYSHKALKTSQSCFKQSLIDRVSMNTEIALTHCHMHYYFFIHVNLINNNDHLLHGIN